jgi:uncharacterized protein YbjT (DUF2867 family)
MKDNYKQYLVTGATGRIGKLVVKELLGRNKRVRILTRKANYMEFPAEVEVFWVI